MDKRRIGSRVAEWRTARRITAQELATRCGVSKEAISEIEGGAAKRITGRMLFLLAQALRVRIFHLLE